MFNHSMIPHNSFQRFAFHGKEEQVDGERDGWWAQHKKHDSSFEKEEGWGGMRGGWGGEALGCAGGWRVGWGGCLLYEQLVKVLIGGAFPRATSLHVSAALKLLLINGPKGPKLILYSHKALMQGKVGANGTLGKQSSQEGGGGGWAEDADAVISSTEVDTDTHREEGRGWGSKWK